MVPTKRQQMKKQAKFTDIVLMELERKYNKNRISSNPILSFSMEGHDFYSQIATDNLYSDPPTQSHPSCINKYSNIIAQHNF